MRSGLFACRCCLAGGGRCRRQGGPRDPSSARRVPAQFLEVRRRGVRKGRFQHRCRRLERRRPAGSRDRRTSPSCRGRAVAGRRGVPCRRHEPRQPRRRRRPNRRHRRSPERRGGRWCLANCRLENRSKCRQSDGNSERVGRRRTAAGHRQRRAFGLCNLHGATHGRRCGRRNTGRRGPSRECCRRGWLLGTQWRTGVRNRRLDCRGLLGKLARRSCPSWTR